jgi:hypothetical protein
MSPEMILRYLYYLTYLYSGRNEWKACYAAWAKFGNDIGTDKYEALLAMLMTFDKQYGSKQ